jgi:hypothetical protein
MPKLRLSEVIAEKKIEVAGLSKDVQQAIETLLAQENTLGNIDEATAEKLRLIAKSLDVSLFDLFTSVEKFYRLKIFEYLNEPEYSGSQKENLEKLFAKLPSSSKISFNLLTIYATQVLPESLLRDSDLKQICKFLDISLEALKDVFDLPRQTISVESILLKLGITLDEFSLLIEVPKKFIPWLSLEKIKIPKVSPMQRVDFELNGENFNETRTENFVEEAMIENFTLIDLCGIAFLCELRKDLCPEPCR